MPKCDYCKKKMLTLLTCKCDKHFCIKHCSPEQHDCTHQVKLFEIDYTPSLNKRFIKI